MLLTHSHGRHAAAARRFAILLVVACGCTADESLRRVDFPEVESSAVRIGSAESADAAIGRVVAARFTDGGEHVVVLDYAPPYVKVFRRDGTLQTAFLDRGGGPLEIRDPAALAVAGDSLILVADGSRRVAVFTMDGQLRGEGRTKYPVLAAVSGCDGEWMIYGPAFKQGREPSWLHRLRIQEGVARSEELEFREALGGGTIGNGLAYGMARNGDTVRVWHVLSEDPSVLMSACGQRRATARGVSALLRRGAPNARGETVRMTVEPGNRTLAGMATVPDGVVLAAQVVPEPGAPAVTEFTLITDGAERTVAVEGAYTLRDGHPRMGVLVRTTDPVPRLFAVPRDGLRKMFVPEP